MEFNLANQPVTVFAFDYTTGAPKTGISANIRIHVGNVSTNFATMAALANTTVNEVSTNNAPGMYMGLLSAAETNSREILVTGNCAVANVAVVGRQITITPANHSLQVINAQGQVTLSGTQNFNNTGTMTGNITGNITGTITGNLTGSVGSVTGNVGAVTGNIGGLLAGNVSGSIVGTVASVVGAVGSVTGNVAAVTGNLGGIVVGSVGSVLGAVGSVTGAVGSVTGAVGSVTGNVGNVTGNMGGSVFGSVLGTVASVADITTSGGIVSADVKKVNAVTVTGNGAVGSEWGP